MDNLRKYIEAEIATADGLSAENNLDDAFRYLERAHILGQASTWQHTRIHWRMFKLGLAMHSPREIWGQFIRIVGAATKTPLGIYPPGNTGSSNVWFFKPMPIPDDLAAIIETARRAAR